MKRGFASGHLRWLPVSWPGLGTRVGRLMTGSGWISGNQQVKLSLRANSDAPGHSRRLISAIPPDRTRYVRPGSRTAIVQGGSRRHLDIIDAAGRYGDRLAVLSHPVEMKLDRFADPLFGFCHFDASRFIQARPGSARAREETAWCEW